jgi:isoleucyl-tRNA synthetase
MNETNKHTINDKELATLAFWNEAKIFEKTLHHPASLETPKGDFSFYDGPPFATGMPHHGHILAGTIKDMIPRYQTMRGNHVRRVWGWDCHGLPVENLIEKKLGLNHKKEIEEYGIDKFNEAAKNSVLEYEHEWKKIVPRLGRFIDMEHAYKTMDASYTESIWWSFSELYKKGLAYEGHKIMHVCTRCETSLAQSEVALGYKDVTDISVTAKLELVDEPRVYLLAWTTTPWTLPGNVAAAVKQDAEYVYFTMDGEVHAGNTYIVASDRISYATKGAAHTVVRTVMGSELVGKKYIPVFDYYKDVELENKENIWKVWHADFVTMDTGTGIVHEAPAFGAEDMELAKKLSLPIIKHVRMDGTFAPEVSDFQGLYVKQKGDTQSTDIEIIKKLAHTGKLFAKEKLIHSYPHCWRCDTPLLNYATSSWFVDVPKLKEKLISENQKIGWVPDHIKDGRFGKWLEGAREWAVSRSRYWGAPLPVWKCADCDKVEVIGSLDELGKKLSANNTYSAMRHGECVGNTMDLADSGKNTDNHLTEKGRADTLLEAQRLLSEGKPDIIITSPLLRARETTQILKDSLGLSEDAIIVDERLREFGFGAHDGKKFDEFWDEMRYLHYHFDATMEGSESYRMVQERMLSVVLDAEKKYIGKKVLLVTHGGPMWMLIAATKHMSDDQARAYRQEMKKIQGPRYFLPNARAIDLEYVPFPNNGKALDFHRPHIDEVVYPCSCGATMKRIPDVNQEACRLRNCTTHLKTKIFLQRCFQQTSLLRVWTRQEGGSTRS